ncbi:NUDIX hydrolase [Neobacillus rhizosphaerae]|uniref:NUDIX hydrolase n=1 Tax=Neobacillus rhizosphaerae TaxID=2880965 RepID=UPI003D285A40
MEKDKTLLELAGMKLKEDGFHRPYFDLEENDGVVILAKEGDSFLLIEQYRKPVGTTVQQLPGGGVKEGEELEQAARREFFEETGYQCGTVHYLGFLQPASWRTNEITHAFFKEEIGPKYHQQLEEHENIKVIKVKINECLNKVKENKMNDSELCYALLQSILKGYITVQSSINSKS